MSFTRPSFLRRKRDVLGIEFVSKEPRWSEKKGPTFLRAPFKGYAFNVDTTEIVSARDCFLRADNASFFAVAAWRFAFCFADG